MNKLLACKTFAKWCFFALSLLNAADMIFTSYLIKRYGVRIETNPAMAALWGSGPWAFVLVKLSLSALMAGIGLHWRRFKKWFVVAAAPVLFYGYAVLMSAYLIFFSQ